MSKRKGNEDFKKVKKRVGKLTQLPSNLQPILLQSKALVVPSQPLSTPLDSRLAEQLRGIIGKLHHYKKLVRKECLSQLRDLCLSHRQDPSLWQSEWSNLLPALCIL